MSLNTGQSTAVRGQVLVVEDDSAMRSSLEGLLALEFDVQSVADTREAERAMRSSRFDLVLTDHELPGETGLQFLKRIRSQFPDTMGILVTGHGDSPEVNAAEARGLVMRVIAKPYDPERMLRWVKNALQLARMQQATNRLQKRAAVRK